MATSPTVHPERPSAAGAAFSRSLSGPIWPAGAKIFEKDVLRTGVWTVGSRQWIVTRYTLRRLVDNFARARRWGLRVPVVWNHSWDARDKIGEVIGLQLHGDTLWARFWAKDLDDQRRLSSTANEASVEVRQPWRDGRGELYDIMLVHLAVVQLPVVPNQFPFRELRLFQPLTGAIRMSEQAAAATASSVSTHRDLVRALNQLLSRLPGWDLVSEEAPVAEVTRRIESLVNDFAQPGSADGDATRETIERLQSEVEALTRQLQTERARIAEQQRQQFVQVLDRLVADGRISPADRTGLLEAGEPTGYRLSLLTPFEKLPTGSAFPIRPLARTVADPSPPLVAGPAEMTSDRAREIAQSFRP
jgi:hypothetical protein